MFRVVVSDTSLFKDSIDTVAQIIGEGIFKVSEGGINLTAADRAMVAVVDLRLEPSAFEVFSIKQNGTIGVNIENLLQILKRAKSDDKIEMETSPEGNKLSIKMVGKSSRKFSIPLLDLSQGEIPDIEKLDFPTKMQMRTSSVEEGIEDAYILSDSVLIKAEAGKVTLTTDGNSSTSEMTVDKDAGLLSFEGVNSQSRYPLEYLKKMIKASKISPVVSLKMGKDFPLKMEFSSPGKCSVSFVLAPRVEE